MMKLPPLFVILFLVQTPAWSQSDLDLALRNLKKDASAGAVSTVATAANTILSQDGFSEHAQDEISNAFCRSSAGLNCAPLARVDSYTPIHIYSLNEGRLVAIIANVKAGGKLVAMLFTFTRAGAGYDVGSVTTLYDDAEAHVDQLPSPRPDTLRMLVYGPEVNANRSPMSVVIVDIAEDGTKILYERHHLWEGRISHDDGVVKIESTSTEELKDSTGRSVPTKSTITLNLAHAEAKESEQKVPFSEIKPE